MLPEDKCDKITAIHTQGPNLINLSMNWLVNIGFSVPRKKKSYWDYMKNKEGQNKDIRSGMFDNQVTG